MSKAEHTEPFPEYQEGGETPYETLGRWREELHGISKGVRASAQNLFPRVDIQQPLVFSFPTGTGNGDIRMSIAPAPGQEGALVCVVQTDSLSVEPFGPLKSSRQVAALESMLTGFRDIAAADATADAALHSAIQIFFRHVLLQLKQEAGNRYHGTHNLNLLNELTQKADAMSAHVRGEKDRLHLEHIRSTAPRSTPFKKPESMFPTIITEEGHILHGKKAISRKRIGSGGQKGDVERFRLDAEPVKVGSQMYAYKDLVPLAPKEAAFVQEIHAIDPTITGQPVRVGGEVKGYAFIHGKHGRALAEATEVIDEKELLYFFYDLAQKLKKLNEHGLHHLDIKPDNIVWEDAGTSRAKIIDFGTMQRRKFAADEEGYSAEFEGGQPAITPMYAAIEQLGSGGRHYTGKSDMYSLALTMLHLLTHKAPFPGRGNIFFQRAQGTVSLEGLDSPMERLLRSMMHVHPWERPQWSNVLQDLCAIMKNKGMALPPGAAVTPSKRSFSFWRNKA